MRRIVLCLFVVIALASVSYGYTYRKTRSVNNRLEQFVSEYDKLLKTFPEHRIIINKLYENYSGWIIPLAEHYGIEPLIALSSAKNVDEVLPIMYAYSEEFTDLYKSLRANGLPDRPRAELSLLFLQAFLITDEEQSSNFHKELHSLILKDKEISRQGREANYNARQIVKSQSMPRNLLHELKQENPNEYKVLMSKISKADYETLKACVEYPNAIAFLLNTGRAGADLIERTEGQAITLAWFLEADYQKKLPEQFRIYPRLSEAIKYCGADAYFTIMVCPDLFFQLVTLLQGDMQARYSMAYAVILCQTGEKNERAKFLETLTKRECQRLAYYAAELMNLPDEGEFFGSSLAPIREELFFEFTASYGELAVEVCKKYSVTVDVSDLFMQDWDGVNQDVTPVLRALIDYNYAGLKAALDYRELKDIQKFVLNYPNAFEREFILMYYDEIMETLKKRNVFREGAGIASDIAQGLAYVASELKDDIGELIAGLIQKPELKQPIAETTELVATLLEAIAELIDENSYELSNIIFTTSYAEKNFLQSMEIISNDSLEKIFAEISFANNFTADEVKDKLSEIFQQTDKRSVAIISQSLLPSWKNFADFVKFIQKKASDRIPIVSILTYPAKEEKLLIEPWFTKLETDFLTNIKAETIRDIAEEKIMNYIGIKSIINQLIH